MRIDQWDQKPHQSWKSVRRGISVVLDEKEAIFLITQLSAQLAGLRLVVKTEYRDPGALVSTDGLELTLDLIPAMAQTQPGEDPPKRT